MERDERKVLSSRACCVKTDGMAALQAGSLRERKAGHASKCTGGSDRLECQLTRELL